jgi:4'-phosphopantetheinyl transferase
VTSRDDIYLWSARIDGMTREALDACQALLSPAERARAASHLLPSVQRARLACRGFLRMVLSRHAAVAPDVWRFGRGARGKPFVARPARAGLAFSLSHSGGLVICAVTKGTRVGADIEDLRREVAERAIAARFYSDEERRALAALPATKRRYRFFALWTLREAYLKARGIGLALPLEQFEFDLDGERPRLLALPAAARDDPAHWHFRQLRIGSAHVVSLAIERNPRRRPAVHLRHLGFSEDVNK